jgi:hypothetical protein
MKHPMPMRAVKPNAFTMPAAPDDAMNDHDADNAKRKGRIGYADMPPSGKPC